MIQSRISTDGRTTIPLAVRRALGLRSGDWVEHLIHDDKVVLRRVGPLKPQSDSGTAT